MKLDKNIKQFFYICLLLLMFSTSCNSQPSTTEPIEEPLKDGEEASPLSAEYKLGVIMPGPIEDADFNSLGYEAVQRIKDVYGIEVDFSEKVSVADAERVGREYIGSGYNIIAYHGGQFVAAAMTLVEEYPDVSFIIYTAGENPEFEKDNVWNVGLRYFPASYPVGVVAANVTQTKKVGFIAGIKTPIFIAGLNSYNDGVKVTDSTVEVEYSFIGDQNDSVKARQTAEAMIGEGVDVITVFLNQGVFGVHEAVLDAEEKIYIMTINTDKSESAPDNYITSIVANFGDVWEFIVGEVMDDNKSGYYPMNLGKGFSLAPYRNISSDLEEEVIALCEQIQEGEYVVEEDNQNLP